MNDSTGINEILLDVKNLSVTYNTNDNNANDNNINYNNINYNRVYAVKGVDFTINRGDSLGIVGESGSGKSTLALAILRLLPGSKTTVTGKVKFCGVDLLKLNESELRQYRWNKLAVVFQKSMNTFSPVHKIGVQMADIYRVHKPSASKKEIFEHCTNLLRLVNLSDRVYNLYPHEMSGGMIQRVSIAVSLLHDPDLIVFDEATTALDVITQRQILKEISSIEEKMNMTRIMITHDISVVASTCKKIIVMYAGEIMESGYVRDVLKNPLHPYTKGLLASFPSLKGEKTELKTIPGFLPDLSEYKEECVFAPRCSFVYNECRNGRPSLVAGENGRKVACFAMSGGVN